jgi:hypothetical protein
MVASKIEPPGSSSILIFIALQNSSKILKTWIKSTKNSKSKSVAKEVGCFLKMRPIPDLSLLIVGAV